MKKSFQAATVSFLLLTLLPLIGAIPAAAQGAKQGAGKPVAVAVYEVAARPFADRIEAIGTAMANESATLSAGVTESITAINFEEGKPVAAGTVIAELSASEEMAQLDEARKAHERYAALARTNAASVARRDEELARLRTAEAQVNDRRIVVPFDGIAGFRHVAVGDMASPGTVITTIYDIDPIKLEFAVPEGFLSILKPGLEIQARTEAWPETLFKGAITAINPGIDAATRTIAVKAEIPNADGRLKPGLLMTVNVVKNERQSLSVPETTLTANGANRFVFIVTPENKIEQRTVEIGAREAGYVEIRDGLTAGEKVVAEGLQKIRAGAVVTIQKTVTIEDTVQQAIDQAVPRKRDALTTLQERGALPKPAAGGAE